jgi:bisphosphoglycerate-dependent phosphoglycerate mutase
MKPPIISDKYNNNFSVYENCYYESVKYGESKEDVLNRVLPYFENDIQYTLKNGKIPLIVSHKHCVRVLMKYLLNMDDYDFENYTFPPSSIMELEFDNKRNLKGYDIIKY